MQVRDEAVAEARAICRDEDGFGESATCARYIDVAVRAGADVYDAARAAFEQLSEELATRGRSIVSDPHAAWNSRDYGSRCLRASDALRERAKCWPLRRAHDALERLAAKAVAA